MIFATVGTDEHPFRRLVEELHRLVKEGKVKERVVVQRGYTPYSGDLLETYEILPFPRLLEFIKKARVVITHGGPGSIALSLMNGKIPVVIPRDPKFGEIVDDHQVRFVRFLQGGGKIIPVFRIQDLQDAILNYNPSFFEYNPQGKISGFVEKFEAVLRSKGIL